MSSRRKLVDFRQYIDMLLFNGNLCIVQTVSQVCPYAKNSSNLNCTRNRLMMGGRLGKANE